MATVIGQFTCTDVACKVLRQGEGRDRSEKSDGCHGNTHHYDGALPLNAHRRR